MHVLLFAVNCVGNYLLWWKASVLLLRFTLCVDFWKRLHWFLKCIWLTMAVGGFWIIMKYVLQCACVHTPACMCLTEIAPVGVWGVFVMQCVFLVVDVFVFWSSSFRRYTCEMWLRIHWLHTPDGLYDYECLASTHSYLLFNVLFFSQQHSVPVFYLRGSGSHDGCGSTQTTVV